MANPNRGEVALKVRDQTWTIVFDINGICEAEEATGQNLFSDLSRVSTLRTLLWAGLRARHPQITRAEAGNIIAAAGFDAVQKAVLEAMAIAFPKKEIEENPR
jgi:hypothetical protein